MEIADTNFTVSGSKLRMSPFQSCRLKVSSKLGVQPSGQTITLHRRQRTRIDPVVEKVRCPEIRRLKSKICERRLISSSESGKEARECKVSVARGEGELEEDWKMEVEEEVQSEKELDEHRKRLPKQLRKIEEFAEMGPLFRRDRRKSGSKICKSWSRSGMIFCREHEKIRKKVSKVAKFAGQIEEASQGRLRL